MPIYPGDSRSRILHKTHVPDVVAGLVHDAMAPLVALAAVREAVRRGSRVRFLQVLPADLSEADHAGVEAALFSIAIKALRAQPRVPCTFESVVGTPATTLVEESRHAALLVVGHGAPESHAKSQVAVAEYCQEHCACEVLVVTTP
jgi:nucleotide-binding universal stress UspA family protein